MIKSTCKLKIMKIILAALVTLVITATGCTTAQVLRSIDAAYRAVRMILTDPAVSAQISSGDMDQLADIERQYLKAADDIRNTGVDNARPLSVIVDCADEFLVVLDKLVLDGTHEREINAIGLSVRFLRKQIQRE